MKDERQREVNREGEKEGEVVWGRQVEMEDEGYGKEGIMKDSRSGGREKRHR